MYKRQSEEEVSQAIATFKQNKQQQVEQQQNANASLQNEVAAAQKDAEQARIEDVYKRQIQIRLHCLYIASILTTQDRLISIKQMCQKKYGKI